MGDYHSCDLLEVKGLHELELVVLAHHHENTLGDHQYGSLTPLVIPQGHVEGE